MDQERNAATSLLNSDARRRHAVFIAFAALVLAGNALLTGPLQTLHGMGVQEWPVAFDLLVLLPVVYLWVNRSRGKQAWAGAVTILGVGILAGSWILPEHSQRLWPWLVGLRWLMLAVLLAVQAALVVTLLRAVLGAGRATNLELHLDQAIARRLGERNPMLNLFRMEARLWLYALLRNPVRTPFPGEHHFRGDRQNGNASSQQAFLILVGAEIPLMHVLVHVFSPIAALVVTALSLYGFVFLLAEYRATLHRPMTLDGHTLHLRYGLVHDLSIPCEWIARLEPAAGTARRATGRVRAYGMGAATHKLILQPGTRLRGLFGEQEVTEILVGVDDPARFGRLLSETVRAAADENP